MEDFFMGRLFCRIFPVLFVCCTLAEAALPFSLEPKLPRKIQIGKHTELVLKADDLEIVTPEKPVPAVEIAAKELADALSRRFKAKIPVVNKPSGKRKAIRIGDAVFARTLGVDVSKLDRDGFVIRTFPDGVLIAGRDGTSDPKRTFGSIGVRGEWGSLFGAYDFLERFAGVRYFYVNDLGVVVPKSKVLNLPSIDIYDRPDFLERRFNDYNHGHRPIRRYPGWDSGLNMFRSRVATVQIPSSHGLAQLGYTDRFRKSHPEYFALDHTGKRMIRTPEGYGKTHLCYSSAIRDEIVKDGISYLNGEPPTVRGILDKQKRCRWGYLFPPNTPFFNIMPHDGLQLCCCPECKKHFSKGEQATSDYLWSFFNDVARRIGKEKPEAFVTTVAYAQYRPVPTIPVEKNLLVMLAIRGPWNEYSPALRDADIEKLRTWNKKLGQKVWLWTYPGKYHGNMPGIPHTTPRSLKSFIKRAQPYIFGLYIECETDVLFFNYLTYYIFGKVAWNPDADVEALLDDHVRSLYGPAAKPMKDFFDSIERNWARIASNVVDTALGPATIYPSDLVLWSKIYSPDELKRLSGLFDQAEKLAAKDPDKDYLARVKFARREILDSILNQAAVYTQANDSVKAWRGAMQECRTPVKIDGNLDEEAWKNAPSFALHGLNGKPAEVKTGVKVLFDQENFYFGFECEEPETGKIVAADRKSDDKAIWTDSDVEIFLSPDGDREHFYQLMINAKGSLADLEVQKKVELFAWNSNAEVRTSITPGKKWTAEIRLPRSSMKSISKAGILADFSRHRVLEQTKIGTEYYNWSPFVRKCGDVSRFGTLTFEPDKRINLLDCPDFDQPVIKGRCIGKSWEAGKKIMRDEQIFLTGSASLKLDSSCPHVKQYLRKIKPNTTYEISFFAKMEKIKKLESQWSGFFMRFDPQDNKAQYFPTPPVQFDGTCPWTRFTFRVRTGNTVGLNKKTPYLGISLRKASGTLWIDHIEMYEVKEK